MRYSVVCDKIRIPGKLLNNKCKTCGYLHKRLPRKISLTSVNHYEYYCKNDVLVSMGVMSFQMFLTPLNKILQEDCSFSS